MSSSLGAAVIFLLVGRVELSRACSSRCLIIPTPSTRRSQLTIFVHRFGDDLRMLERFQHASRKAPPQVRDATVAWYDPESGLDLFPCSSDLARHTAEAGAVSTRRGVSVTCPLCRRRAKLEISN